MLFGEYATVCFHAYLKYQPPTNHHKQIQTILRHETSDEHVCLLLIDRHEQEVFGKDVNMAGPRLHPLMPRVPIAEEIQTDRRVTLTNYNHTCRQRLEASSLHLSAVH